MLHKVLVHLWPRCVVSVSRPVLRGPLHKLIDQDGPCLLGIKIVKRRWVCLQLLCKSQSIQHEADVG
jgi:hypothetical protein